MTPMDLRVLLVDDDKNIRSMLAVTLKDFGCDAVVTASASEALQQLKERDFDLVLTDFRMEGQSGIDLVREVSLKHEGTLTVVMTAYASFENAVLAIKEGAYDYLPKPFSNQQLKHVLGKIRTLIQLQKENERLRNSSSRTDHFAGLSSPASARLEDFVLKTAPTDASVLIRGESGTGKTELARLIHLKSNRSSHPFIAVNCTSLSESLLDFELADHGTLFLDEIGDLSLDGQAKLLRFLEDKAPVHPDTRILAATRRNLSEEVSKGTFREDLYFRLNAFECVLVPLRFRKEDLPVLIQRFSEEWFKKQNTPPCAISGEVMALLLAYSWPGNVRELRNVVERLYLLAKGREMRLEDLPNSLRMEPEPHSSERLVSLDQLERVHIQKVLNQEENLEKAAEILGITTVTLWRKRKEYGLR